MAFLMRQEQTVLLLQLSNAVRRYDIEELEAATEAAT